MAWTRSYHVVMRGRRFLGAAFCACSRSRRADVRARGRRSPHGPWPPRRPRRRPPRPTARAHQGAAHATSGAGPGRGRLPDARRRSSRSLRPTSPGARTDRTRPSATPVSGDRCCPASARSPTPSSSSRATASSRTPHRAARDGSTSTPRPGRISSVPARIMRPWSAPTGRSRSRRRASRRSRSAAREATECDAPLRRPCSSCVQRAGRPSPRQSSNPPAGRSCRRRPAPAPPEPSPSDGANGDSSGGSGGGAAGADTDPAPAPGAGPTAAPTKAPTPKPTKKPTEPGIAGSVVAGGKPVTDAQVTISGSGYHHNTTTSSQGRFRSATPPGTYTIAANSPSVSGCGATHGDRPEGRRLGGDDHLHAALIGRLVRLAVVLLVLTSCGSPESASTLRSSGGDSSLPPTEVPGIGRPVRCRRR